MRSALLYPFALVALALLPAATPCAPRALAAPGGGLLTVNVSNSPVSIDADSMELRQKERLVVFTGAVSARRDDLSIQADRVEVKMQEKGEEVESIRSSGNVRIKKGELLASGREGIYDVGADLITLTGEPKVWRGRDAVEGERILLHISDERVEVERARAIMYPSDKQGEKKP